MRHDNGNATGDMPFWVTRAGARIALGVLYACAILSIVLEIVHPFDADGHGVERVHALEFLASYAIYGFTGCVILVLLGRVLRRFVMRGEDYYVRTGRDRGNGDD